MFKNLVRSSKIASYATIKEVRSQIQWQLYEKPEEEDRLSIFFLFPYLSVLSSTVLLYFFLT
jgi:lipid-A-disaccharide synthase-like uncharacterized protein